jgi:hypothetical protein
MLRVALCVACLGTFAWTQDSANPDLGSLARQTRAQHAADEGKSSKAQELVDEMQQEQEAQDNAPLGFKNYDAGDYRLFVPYPYSLEGRENGGAVLLGSRLGVTNTEVLAGAPVPFRPNLSEIEVGNAARQLAQSYGSTAYCSPAPMGSRRAFHCTFSGARLLGREVVGDMIIVVGSSTLIPVMCVSPDDLHQCVSYDQYGYHTCSQRYPSWGEVQRANAAVDLRYRDEKTTYQMCSQIIYPSIQLKEDIVVHPASIPEGKPAKPAPAVAQDTSVVVGAQGPSLADLARRTRQAQQSKPATIDNASWRGVAPDGFQPFMLQYCQNPQQCAEAAVVIPEKTEVVSRTNGQHIFKTTLNGDPVFLYAGPADVNAPYRSLTDVDFIRMRDLANSNGWSHEKTDGVSTQELTIVGRQALMTRFRYQRDQKTWWIGERALIEMGPVPSNPKGGQFLLGCTAPEERFADAEAICTTMVNSLRLP